MPVWHEFTEEMRAAGELVVVGITQEQHPERCRLFAQWQGFDWPILWDPFNLTGSMVVPNVVAVDEYGIVRSIRPRPDTFEDDFLFVDFPVPASPQDVDPVAALEAACAFPEKHGAISAVAALMKGTDGMNGAVERLEREAGEHPDDGRLAFRAGVARRLRYDSSLSRPDDFQAAVDAWSHALALNPDQYIWRRRIQQYGPRLDKPYRFYTWIEEARRDIAARGETPIELRAELTPAELAQPRRDMTASPETAQPDAAGAIRRDEDGLVSIETAVAFDTSGKRPVASVHLAFRPAVTKDTHWNHEAGPPLQVWVAAPDGWKLDRRLLEVPRRTDVAVSTELSNLSFEVQLPADTDDGQIDAYALYYVCSGADGICAYLRQDFAIPVRRPE